MRQWLFVPCIVLFLFTVSCGFTGGGNPYFWKVEKGGKTSYLLGTIHIGISLYELPCSDIIRDKLNKSDVVFVEAKQSDSTKGDAATIFHSPDEEDFNSLSSSSQRFLREKGIYDYLNYTGIVFSMELTCIAENFGLNFFKTQMDLEVESLALRSNTPVKALDKEKQLQAIGSVYTKKDVEEAIKAYPQSCPENVRIFEHYRAGTVPVGRYDGKSSKVLLRDRNEHWLTQFQSAHDEYDNIFVAGGVAHFIDNFNFVDMLKEEGFSVERVSCP